MLVKVGKRRQKMTENCRKWVHLENWLKLVKSYHSRHFEDQWVGGLPEPPPSMKNYKGVVLGPYSLKTFWKGTNFRLVRTKIGPQYKNLAEILKKMVRNWPFSKINSRNSKIEL